MLKEIVEENGRRYWVNPAHVRFIEQDDGDPDRCVIHLDKNEGKVNVLCVAESAMKVAGRFNSP